MDSTCNGLEIVGGIEDRVDALVPITHTGFTVKHTASTGQDRTSWHRLGRPVPYRPFSQYTFRLSTIATHSS